MHVALGEANAAARAWEGCGGEQLLSVWVQPEAVQPQTASASMVSLSEATTEASSQPARMHT